MTLHGAEDNWIVNLQRARELLNEGDDRAAYLIRHGTMRIGLYAPIGIDDQEPHSQDELYLVTAGSAQIIRGAQRRSCTSGDIIFVPAGTVHRFEAIGSGFEVCVVFWGAKGGEAEKSSR